MKSMNMKKTKKIAWGFGSAMFAFVVSASTPAMAEVVVVVNPAKGLSINKLTIYAIQAVRLCSSKEEIYF